MNDFPAIYIVITGLFSLMVFRAFRSASSMDYLLAATQCAGLVLLLSIYRHMALYLLLITAFAYLLSQILTGAKPISRLLPLAGAAAIVLSLSIYP
jgi:preprotein translocase subunit SecY